LLEGYYTEQNKKIPENSGPKDLISGFASWLDKYIERIFLAETVLMILAPHHNVKLDALKRRLEAYDLYKTKEYKIYEIAKKTHDVKHLTRESAERVTHRDIKDAEKIINNIKNGTHPFWRTK
jgi:hypothetical protein